MAVASEYQPSGNEKLVLTGGRSPLSFFREALDLSGAEKPTLGLDLMASTSAEEFEYGKKFVTEFASELGACLVLLQDEFGENNPGQVEDRLGESDVLCVGGASTRRWLDIWHQSGLTNLLLARIQAGELVAAGASVGALNMFELAHSDSPQYEVPPTETWEYEVLPALGVLPGIATVHYSDVVPPAHTKHAPPETVREKSFQNYLRKNPGTWQVALGIDSLAGISYVSGEAIVRDYAADNTNNAIHLFTPDSPHAPVVIRPGEVIPLPVNTTSR